MEYTYKMENICCPSCAGKIERSADKLTEISNFKINVMNQKITFESDTNSIEQLMPKLQKIVSRYEPKCKIKY